MLAAVQNWKKKWWKDWNVLFRHVATDKPRISSMSMEMVGLVGFLCLLALNVGEWLTCLGTTQVRQHAEDILLPGILLLNWLAFQFQWPRGTTLLLRIGAVVALLGFFVATTLGLMR